MESQLKGSHSYKWRDNREVIHVECYGGVVKFARAHGCVFSNQERHRHGASWPSGARTRTSIRQL